MDRRAPLGMDAPNAAGDRARVAAYNDEALRDEFARLVAVRGLTIADRARLLAVGDELEQRARDRASASLQRA